MKTQKIYFFLCVAALILSGVSCNSSDDEQITYTLSESVRVSAFSLAANDSVLANLDTIFFTIDLNGGQIYNADSLPKGTDVSALIANISFDNVGRARGTKDRSSERFGLYVCRVQFYLYGLYYHEPLWRRVDRSGVDAAVYAQRGIGTGNR